MVAISSGNTKLGKVMNISLTPCATCLPDAPCRSKCYAMKAYKQYPNVRQAWNGNTEKARNDLQGFMTEVNNVVQKKKPEYFRWQVAGDILNQAYLDGMNLIARANPKTKFLAFTKKHDLDFTGKAKNLEIVGSLWSNWGEVKNLPVAYMQDGNEKRVNGTEIECPGKCKDCKACWNLSATGKNVVFKAH
jgi:hypothetical protein